MELGSTIKRLRAEKGWNQETLAGKLYVSRQTVSNWETGKSYPDVHSLLILSGLFGVSLDELIKGDVETMKETIRNEDAVRIKKLQLAGAAEMLVLMVGGTVLVEYGGEIGRILGALLCGALAVGIFLTFHRFEQLKADNDLETYRELTAFLEGKALDEIEQEREQKKRRSLRALLIFAAVQGAVMLLIGTLTLLSELR